MQDDLQAFRIYEMDKCWQDFQIPCRWVPDAGYEYGYPQFNYYPPSVYYVGEAIHKVGFQFIDSVKILFALGFVLSALAMFLLVSDILGNFPGFVSALIYTYVPYKAVDVYVRGDMSEFWSMVFYPLVFWAVYKIIRTAKWRYIALLAVSLGLLFMTHLLMSMIFSLSAAVWTLYWLIKEKKFKRIYRVIAGVALGFGFAAFYVLPVILERQYAHTETLTEGYFGYQQHFVNLYKLFISREWGYGSSGFPNEKLNLSTGLIQWIFGLITIGIASLYILLKKKKEHLYLVLTLGALELFTLFMIHVKSSFIWNAIPILSWLQFPWRFLAISIFLLAILAGIGVYLIPKFKVWVGLAIILIAFVLNVGYFIPKAWENITDADKFSGVSWQKELTISIFDYLPIYAKLPPITAAPATPEVLEGMATFSNYTKGSDFQRGIINTGKNGALIRLPLFDFPGMVAKIDGNVVAHVNNNCQGEEFCLGLITFEVPSGEHKIEVELTDTLVRRVGNYLSIVSLVAVGGLYIFKRKK